jgi:hypothetical protein
MQEGNLAKPLICANQCELEVWLEEVWMQAHQCYLSVIAEPEEPQLTARGL